MGGRLLRRRTSDPRLIQHYLETEPIRRLQLGTGPNPLPGWLNSDLFPDIYPEHRDKIVFLDAAKPLPLAEETFDYIFSEHQIAMMSQPAALTMIGECFRVLRPGGRIRIATPDLAAIVDLYNDPLSEPERHYVDWVMGRFWPQVRSGNPRCYVINKMFTAHGHQFIYDQETLSAMLTDAGFVKIVRAAPGESESPMLQGLEAHGRALGDEQVNRFETMVLEGVRPTLAVGA